MATPSEKELEERIEERVKVLLDEFERLLGRSAALLLVPLRVLTYLARLSVPLFLFFTVLPPLLAFSLLATVVARLWIPVSWSRDVYFQYGESLAPWAQLTLPVLVARQPYDVRLDLVVPNTDDVSTLGQSLFVSLSYAPFFVLNDS